MASVTTNKFRSETLGGSVSLSADTFNVALLNNSVTTVPASVLKNYEYWNLTSGAFETSGDGYTAGGQELSGLSVTYSHSTDKATWDADDVSWASSTLSAYGAAIYRATDNLMVCFIEFDDAPKISTNGAFNIVWNTLGIINGT